jgi:hypothetical protein
MHSSLLGVECQQQPMLCSRRLLLELGASAVGQGLVSFLDQLIFF